MLRASARPVADVPANSIYDRKAGVVRELDRPRDLHFPTVIERLNETGRTTGTVLSKEYLYGIFGKRATYRWEPEPVIPVSGHAPDQATMDATIEMVKQHDPSFVFVNLGDVDRFAHADFTGTNVRAQRRTALASVDAQVERFVSLLKSSGRWERSLLVVLADHSMDWCLPQQVISLAGPLGEDPMLAGKVEIAQKRRGPPLLDGAARAARGGQEADATDRARAGRRVQRPRPARPAVGPPCGRPHRLLRRGVAVLRPHTAVEPRPGQPRSPRDAAHPVLPLRRAPGGAARRHVPGARPHHRRRSHGR